MKGLKLGREATAHVKRAEGLNPMIVIKPETESDEKCSYELFTLADDEYLGHILFDAQGHWIYTGEQLTVDESIETARFILKHLEPELFV